MTDRCFWLCQRASEIRQYPVILSKMFFSNALVRVTFSKTFRRSLSMKKTSYLLQNNLVYANLAPHSKLDIPPATTCFSSHIFLKGAL